MNAQEREYAERLVKMLDNVLEIYDNVQRHLLDADYKAAAKQLDAADRIVDNISTLLRGKR